MYFSTPAISFLAEVKTYLVAVTAFLVLVVVSTCLIQ